MRVLKGWGRLDPHNSLFLIPYIVVPPLSLKHLRVQGNDALLKARPHPKAATAEMAPPRQLLVGLRAERVDAGFCEDRYRSTELLQHKITAWGFGGLLDEEWVLVYTGSYRLG